MSEKILQQILAQMNAVQEEVKNMSQRMDIFESELKDVKKDMNNRFDHLDKEVHDIKESVHRIELNQPEDILSLMHQIQNKLEDKTEVLNKRVYNVETEVQRLGRQ